MRPNQFPHNDSTWIILLLYIIIHIAAHFAAPGLLVMSAIISLNAQNLMKSEPSLLNCMRALQVPCDLLFGTRTNRLSVTV